jgi:L-amino acid N-acyltransferase YncA
LKVKHLKLHFKFHRVFHKVVENSVENFEKEAARGLKRKLFQHLPRVASKLSLSKQGRWDVPF